MKLEDCKVGMRVITSRGNLAEVIGFWPNPECAKLRLVMTGQPTSGMIYHLKPSGLKTTAEEILEATLDAFAKATSPP